MYLLNNLKMETLKEPQLSDFYNRDDISAFHVIDKMNQEYNELYLDYMKKMEEIEALKKELNFVNQVFEYPLRNSAVFNLVRVKKGGQDIWIDKVKIYENELRELDMRPKVKYLLDNCNPRCER